MIGQSLNHYRIESKLGERAWVSCYRALDTRLGRPVAIKILPPALATAELKQRFVQEARAASALNHPGIVTIHDLRSTGGVDFIVMEYLDGMTLDRLVGSQKLSPSATGGPLMTTASVKAGRPGTEEGTILGTVAYMSPEQTHGQPVDVKGLRIACSGV